eukprot:COSAG03_NODE_5267_length_1293_cov_1.754606_2_plen_65_part_00
MIYIQILHRNVVYGAGAVDEGVHRRHQHRLEEQVSAPVRGKGGRVRERDREREREREREVEVLE